MDTNTISTSKKKQRDTPRFNDSPSVESENEERFFESKDTKNNYLGLKTKKSESCKTKLIALENYQSASS